MAHVMADLGAALSNGDAVSLLDVCKEVAKTSMAAGTMMVDQRAQRAILVDKHGACRDVPSLQLS